MVRRRYDQGADARIFSSSPVPMRGIGALVVSKMER